MTGPEDKAAWNRIQAVFDAALDLEGEARRAYLEDSFREAPELREPVERLLAAADGSGPLDRPLPDLASTLTQDAGAEIAAAEGRRIGPWRLGALIGTGGMGRVHRAARVDGGFDQVAALKILRWDMADPTLVRRFATERQILADLDHPHIARLLEGGVTDDGLPYVAMEYVDGRPIDEAVEDLDVRARLHLFLDVAEAVQHAHQRLVVHRDLKPSNILVTADGQVRLLDFGVAKILDEAGDAGATQTQAAMATPLYAAPEQLQGGRITTATDVWALGVLLYRMLCGTTPFGDERSELTQLMRSILEEDPRAPSDVATRVHLEADLDTIVLKALEKDPARRYGTAERLADDVRRYLEGRPITARPATIGYRTRKYVRRHRRGLAIATAALVVIAGTVGFYTDRLARERDRVRQEARRTEEVKDFLVSLFEQNDPAVARGEEITARDMLDAGAERIETELGGQPEIQAEMHAVVGGLYQELGAYETSVHHFERAVDLFTAVDGPESVRVGDTLGRLGYAVQELGDYERAEEVLRESLRIQRTHPERTVDLAAAANQLGMHLSYQGDYVEAEQLLRESEQLYAKTLGPDSARRATALSNLGLTVKWSGRMDEAEPIYREALRIRRTVLGDDHTDVAVTLDNLGVLLGQRGDFEESELCFREALDIRRRLLGEDHPDVALNLNNLATLFRVQGRLDDAEPIYRQVIDLNRRALGEDHPRLATNLVNLGSVQLARGRHEEAIEGFETALAIRRSALGSEHVEVANALGHLVDALLAVGRVAEAVEASAEAVRIAEATVDAKSHRVAAALHTHAEALLRAGRPEAARANAVRALAVREEILAEDHPETVASRELVADCEAALGERADG